MTMPEHFEDDASRKAVLFTELRRLLIFNAIRFGSTKPDGALVGLDDSPEVIVEINNEPGAAGDVYMRCVASFNAAAFLQLQDRGEREYAAFVMAVDGERDIFIAVVTQVGAPRLAFKTLSTPCSRTTLAKIYGKICIRIGQPGATYCYIS
jgi:hypothetical protein